MLRWSDWQVGRRRRRRLSNAQQMIREHNAFLTWALARERNLPHIPRRRVDRGGFSGLLDQLPGARKMVGRWWKRVLDCSLLD